MKFEIDHIKETSRDTWMHSHLATLTGYSIEEISVHLKPSDRIHSRSIKKAVEALGFSCSKRFIKFDPKVENPCLMRAVDKGKSGGTWYPFPYYDDTVYFSNGTTLTLEGFLKHFPELRITTMLEIYV